MNELKKWRAAGEAWLDEFEIPKKHRTKVLVGFIAAGFVLGIVAAVTSPRVPVPVLPPPSGSSEPIPPELKIMFSLSILGGVTAMWWAVKAFGYISEYIVKPVFETAVGFAVELCRETKKIMGEA